MKRGDRVYHAASPQCAAKGMATIVRVGKDPISGHTRYLVENDPDSPAGRFGREWWTWNSTRPATETSGFR